MSKNTMNLMNEGKNLSKKTFNTLLEDLLLSFNKNVVQPCEMIGILAAQSIGEPLTQFTLNTFHSTGVSDVVSNMSAMLRFKELISFSKNIKTPFMKIHLTEEFKYNEETVLQFANMIENTIFKDIIIGTEIYFERDFDLKDSVHSKDKMDSNPKNIFFINASNKNVSLKSLPWVYRFIIDKELLLEKNISLLTIKSQFVKFWQTSFVDTKGFRKKEKEIVNLINNMCILSTSESTDEPIIHIRIDMNEYGYTQILDILNIIETNFRVKGIDSIEKAYCKKEIEYVFDKETGKIVEKEEFVITTKGSNIHDIFYYEGVDNKRTMSNDVYSIYKIWGIEATRSALIKEINSIYYNNSVDLNFQHLSILVDIMVQTGSVTPVNRYGINKLDTDPLSRASFEKTIEQLIQAAVFQEKDKMNSVSSRIIAGRVINGGTGMMDILVDTYKLENTEYIEDKYLVDISDVHIPSMIEDPFINEMYN
jgi:DNA-directed RNA polymerase II subunit RPB1